MHNVEDEEEVGNEIELGWWVWVRVQVRVRVSLIWRKRRVGREVGGKEEGVDFSLLEMQARPQHKPLTP